MEVINMNDGNQVQIESAQLIPPKRKRGRPRKNHALFPGDKALVPQRVEGKRKPRRKKMDSSGASFTDNAYVGQTVHGVLDGSFDAGYLVTVRVGNTDTVLRGVVFEPRLSVPISRMNDIAPNVKLTRREENIVLPPGPSLSTQGPNFACVTTPSTPLPSLPLSLPAGTSQQTSTPLAVQAAVAPVADIPKQACSVLAPSNGFSQKADGTHSLQTTEGSSSKPPESLSLMPQPKPTVTEPNPLPEQPVQIQAGSVVFSHPSLPNVAGSVSHTEQVAPNPEKPMDELEQGVATTETFSNTEPPNLPAESSSRAEQALPDTTSSVELSLGAADKVKDE